MTLIKSIPAFFNTRIHLSWADRLRVLWHGTLTYRGEINPDPGDFEVDAWIDVPYIFSGKPQGYEIADEEDGGTV